MASKNQTKKKAQENGSGKFDPESIQLEQEDFTVDPQVVIPQLQQEVSELRLTNQTLAAKTLEYKRRALTAEHQLEALGANQEDGEDE